MNLASQSTFNLNRNYHLPWQESLAAVVILLAAWLFGFMNTRSPVEPLVHNVIPGAVTVKAEGEIFSGYNAAGELLGYAAAADATGYGGPIYLLVGINPNGVIQAIQIIEQRETPGFFALLDAKKFVQSFLGKSASQPFVLGRDVDSVSGASLSAGAVARAVYLSSQKIRTGGLKNIATPVRFGWPETALLILFAGAVALPKMRSSRAFGRLRWALMLASMLLIGFWLNQPLTIANYASLLSGYWPAWQDHLYWYMLLFGFTGYTLLTGRNVYCYAICPFGAAQECFGKMGSVNAFLPVQAYGQLKWVPRWLGVLALGLGLAFRQPGGASFEPFGTLFSFSAGFFPWVLLVVVLFASMIILRPFCYYLCPVGPIMDFLLFIRTQVKKLWKTRQILEK
jgi:hypothetical protein